MKTTCLLLALLLPLALHAEPAAPLTTAVLDFQTSGDKLEKKGAEVAILLNTQLSAAPGLVLVERQEIDKALGEQELGLSGTVTPESAAKIGTLTGAKVLVTGRVFSAGDKFFVVAKIMSTETSRVYGELATFQDLAGLDKATAELAKKIEGVIEKRGDTLVSHVETAAERLERLKKLVDGKKLPSVAVNITERHLHLPTIDPAAETEMKSILQQLGFEVIDPKDSNKQADVAITGEGFSELGGRHGNLISCRARLEVKMSRPGTGKTLLVDRQTDVAVDLAENIAGKSSLENAAHKLLDRIVPKIVEP
jgi:hypothetical protein